MKLLLLALLITSFVTNAQDLDNAATKKSTPLNLNLDINSLKLDINKTGESEFGLITEQAVEQKNIFDRVPPKRKPIVTMGLVYRNNGNTTQEGIQPIRFKDANKIQTPITVFAK